MFARADFSVGGASLLACKRSGNGNEGVERRIEPFDARKSAVRQLKRRNFARPQQPRSLANREKREIAIGAGGSHN
jgi:hypothetical protein